MIVEKTVVRTLMPVEYWEGGHTYTVFGIEFNHGGGVRKTRYEDVTMELTTHSWGFTQTTGE